MIILIGLGFSLMVFLVLFWFFSNAESKQLKAVAAAQDKLTSKKFTISSKDLASIAGDDVMTTQLDLARAYIETERKNLAKSILKNVKENGNSEQRQEAKRLLAALLRVS